MGRIIKNLKPYWKTIIIIVLLLILQAVCDLALPQYTSDIIDTGIQNSGVEHVIPEAITASEYEKAQLFMTAQEKNNGFPYINEITIFIDVRKKVKRN